LKIIELLFGITITIAAIDISFGINFYQLYVDTKMEHATALLKSGLRANVVSERVGYMHPIKFNKMFQKHFGITPKKYQQANGVITSKRLMKLVVK
jgi:AraC-like DNA-binding protein